MKISLAYRMQFMKKFSFLLGAGIPVLHALDIITEKEEHTKRKQLLETIVMRIKSGMSISKSFNTRPPLLDQSSLRIIESSEQSGRMKEGIERLSKSLESQGVRRKRLVAALLYPSCVILFSVVLISFLLFYVFPKILPLLTQANIELPPTTRLLLFTYSFLKNNGIVLAFTMVTIVFMLIWLWKKNVKMQVKLFFLINKIPLLGKWLRLNFISNFSHSLSIYLQSGFTLVEALSHCGDSETNPNYKSTFQSLARRVRYGERFSKAVLVYPQLFLNEAVQFISLAEETGNLSHTLLHLAQSADNDLDEIQKYLFSLIEPALMLVLGIIVGFIALSLITPLYSITTSINPTKL